MKILCLERGEPGHFLAWIEDGDKYKKILLHDDGKTEELNDVDKSGYKDYGHFVSVMGKFNPNYIFLDNPVEVNDPFDFEDIERAMLELDRQTRKLK